MEDYDADADAQTQPNGDTDVDPASTQNPLDSTDYHHNTVVESGDVAAQQAAQRELNSVKGVRNRRIPNEKRTTTPYMTKYERARVLGTRALQIRCVTHIFWK